MKHVYVAQSSNGRFAVLARVDENSPWVQVESARNRANVKEFIELCRLDDDAGRAETIADAPDEDYWGSDETVTPP
jgi:hypothetical protein